MNWLIPLLNLFGITPDKYPFLVLGVIMVAGIIYNRISLGNKLGKIKDDILIIVDLLSKDHPEITQ
jgi:hypothetical protein